MGRSMARAAGWTAVLVIAVCLRLVSWRHVDPAAPGTQPFDGDCQYHRLRAEQIASSFPHVPWSDPQLGDGGIDILWPPLFDEVIASAAMLAAGGAPTPQDVARAAAWTPVILGVATVPLVGWLAATVAGPGAALGAALFLALSAMHAFYSAYGRSDQHVLELLLGVTVLLAYARALVARTRGEWWRAVVALGAAIALAFWNWQGSALNLSFLAVFVAIWHISAPREPRGSPAAALGVGCAVGTVSLLVSVALLGPPGALARGTIHGVTGLHVGLTAATGLFGGALWTARRLRPQSAPGWRAAEVMGAGVAPLLGLLLAPGLALGIGRGLAALLNGNRWYQSISEFQPMLFGGYSSLGHEVTDALLLYGLGPLLALAGAAALRDRWRAGDERTRSTTLLLAVWGATTFALALARNRFGLYASAPLAIWCWMGLRHAQARWVPGLSRGVLGAVFASTVVAAVVGGPTIAWARNAFAQAAVSAGPLLAWTRGRPDPTGAPAVYARWRWGHHVRALARRPAIANPFGTEGGARGFEEALRVFLSADESEVERVLRDRRAGYFLVEDPLGDALSYQDALPAGERVGEVTSTWRTGRTFVENARYHALVSYRLHFHDGSAVEGFPALGGFRLLRETPPSEPARSDRPAYSLFGFVPGARLAVTGAPSGAVVSATAAIKTNTGREFWWRTTARADAAGRVELRVPYATGENGSTRATPFEVMGGEGKRTVSVAEDSVIVGAAIPVDLPPAAPGRDRADAPRLSTAR